VESFGIHRLSLSSGVTDAHKDAALWLREKGKGSLFADSGTRVGSAGGGELLGIVLL